MDRKDTLAEIIDNLDNYIEKRGQCWKHKRLSKYNSPAIVVDKDFQSRVKELVRRDLKPKNGVLNRDSSSTFKVVSRHATNDLILHFDIRRYYESIKFEMVEKFLAKDFDEYELDFIKKFYFADDGLRRGLFASPILSEIVGAQIDNLVAKITHEHGWRGKLAYSRYYDDLIFSGLSLEELRASEAILVQELEMKGFEPNTKKTKILRNASAKILGLRVHEGRVIVPKSFKNKLRLRQYYAEQMLTKVKSGDYSCAEYALVAVGSVIGSLRYTINNSEQPNPKFQLLLEQYCWIFAKLENLCRGLRDDENPFVLEGAERAALDAISKRRRPRKGWSDEELAEIDNIINSLRPSNVANSQIISAL